MKTDNINRKKQIYVLMLFFMLILSAVFLNSFYWPYEEISKRKVIVGAIVFIFVGVIPILSIKINHFYTFVEHILQQVCDVLKNIKYLFLQML